VVACCSRSDIEGVLDGRGIVVWGNGLVANRQLPASHLGQVLQAQDGLQPVTAKQLQVTAQDCQG